MPAPEWLLFKRPISRLSRTSRTIVTQKKSIKRTQKESPACKIKVLRQEGHSLYRKAARHVVTIGLFSGLLFTPMTASAGIFSVFSARTAQADTAGVGTDTNSQTIALASTTIGPGAFSGTSSTPSDIVISGAALAPAMGPVGNAEEADQFAGSGGYIAVYTVRAGDTLKGIADMFDVTPATVMWANDLTTKSKLKEGMFLTIPPIDGRVIIVKKGETLQSLAKKYGVEVGAIAFANDMSTEDTLETGATIVVPDEDLTAPTDKTVTKTPIKTTAVKSTQKPSAGNYFIYPLPTGLSRWVRGIHGNCSCGVDISAPSGTPIYAVADGTVVTTKTSGYNTGWGSYVIINHTLPNGRRAQTLSAHMSRVIAVPGQTVKAGDVIGYVGTTGKVTGPHLHIEVTGVSNPFTDPRYGR